MFNRVYYYKLYLATYLTELGQIEKAEIVWKTIS